MTKILKMTKVLLLSMIVAVNGIMISTAADEPDSTFYVTDGGVELTETQYNNLISAFAESTINTMSREQIDIYKDLTDLVSEEVVVRLDENNNCLGVGVMPLTVLEDVAQTEYKRITLKFVGSVTAGDRKTVSIVNEWVRLPAYRSYDVIAIRTNDTDLYYSFTNQLITARQVYDGNTVNYNANSGASHFKFCDKGIGLSMNLSDSASSSIVCELVVTLSTTKSNIVVAGTYQHATTNINLSRSQQYDITPIGYGCVVDFYDSAKSYYDQSPGCVIGG